MTLYKRPDFDRMFGGRFIDRGEFPLMYCYDVFICFVPDLFIDCLYTLNGLHPAFKYAFWEMYEKLTDTKNHKFLSYLNQICARMFGILFTSDMIDFVLKLVRRLCE